MSSTTSAPDPATATTVRCEHCGRLNRVAAAAPGVPRCGNCHAALPWIVDTDDRTFAEVAEQATIPVLVDLWAPWCAPCRTVSPALETLARDYADKLKLVKVNIDEAPELARRLAVQAVPTLLLLGDGQIISRKTGAAPIHALREWVEQGIPDIAGAAK